jgi:hypothetical protein
VRTHQHPALYSSVACRAVARVDDADAVVYGTVGYHAPEVVRAELSPASDLYTVGRTLAVLALGIEPARGGIATELPDDHPLLLRHESLHRLLLRATHPDPLYRFGSADEMAEQLDGVRRGTGVDEQRCACAVRGLPPRVARGVAAPEIVLGRLRSPDRRSAAGCSAASRPRPSHRWSTLALATAASTRSRRVRRPLLDVGRARTNSHRRRRQRAADERRAQRSTSFAASTGSPAPVASHLLAPPGRAVPRAAGRPVQRPRRRRRAAVEATLLRRRRIGRRRRAARGRGAAGAARSGPVRR